MKSSGLKKKRKNERRENSARREISKMAKKTPLTVTRTLSAETRRKMSEAQRRRWAKTRNGGNAPAPSTKATERPTNTLGLLLQGLAESYSNDKTAPGVQFGYLRKEGLFYCAIHRYTLAYGEGKYVVCSATASTIGEALREVAKKWMKRGEILAKLRDVLNNA
jgi:ribosomal protein L44E